MSMLGVLLRLVCALFVMEHRDIQVLNAIEGFCSYFPGDNVPHFQSLDLLRDAFHSVAQGCGEEEMVVSLAKRRNSLKDVPFRLVRRRRRYDASALLCLVESFSWASTPRRRPHHETILADAHRLGIPLWPQLGDSFSGDARLGEDACAVVAISAISESSHRGSLVSAVLERQQKRMRIGSLITSLTAEHQQLILQRFKRLSNRSAQERFRRHQLKTRLATVTNEGARGITDAVSDKQWPRQDTWRLFSLVEA